MMLRHVPGQVLGDELGAESGARLVLVGAIVLVTC